MSDRFLAFVVGHKHWDEKISNAFENDNATSSPLPPLSTYTSRTKISTVRERQGGKLTVGAVVEEGRRKGQHEKLAIAAVVEEVI